MDHKNKIDQNKAYVLKPPVEYIEENTPLKITPVVLRYGLLNQDEKQRLIKATIFKTKTLLKTVKWNEIEIEIADAMTSREKELLKSLYYKNLNGIDWYFIENEVKEVYNDTALMHLNQQLTNLLITFHITEGIKLQMKDNEIDLRMLNTPPFMMPTMDSTKPIELLYQYLDTVFKTHNNPIIGL